MTPRNRDYEFVNAKDGKPLVVSFQGWKCNVVMQRYANGGLSLRLVDPSDLTSIAHATVNLPGVQLAPEEALIKDYSENAGVLDYLQEAGIVIDMGERITSGHAKLAVVQMRPNLLSQWNEFASSLTDSERSR